MSFREPKDLLNNDPSIGRSFEGMPVAGGVNQSKLRPEDFIALVQDISSVRIKEPLKFQ